MVSVTFSVTFDTPSRKFIDDGAKPYLLGDHECLGAWEPLKALMLEENTGVWSTSVILPEGSAVTFKFLLISAGGIASAWECIPGDRALIVVKPADGVTSLQSPLYVFGQLPEGHPKRRCGRSRWIESENALLLDPRYGELRLVLGAYVGRPGVSLMPSAVTTTSAAAVDSCQVSLRTDGSLTAVRSGPVRVSCGVGETASVDTYTYPVATSTCSTAAPPRIGTFLLRGPLTTLRSGPASITFDIVAPHQTSQTLRSEEEQAADHRHRHHEADEGKAGPTPVWSAVIPLHAALWSGHGRRHRPEDGGKKDEGKRDEGKPLTYPDRGSFLWPVMFNGEVAGDIYVEWLLLRAFVPAPLSNSSRESGSMLANVWRKRWAPKHTVDVGHRGLGRSYRIIPGQRQATVRENTLLSLQLAHVPPILDHKGLDKEPLPSLFPSKGEYPSLPSRVKNRGGGGVSYVELDVMLTKDRVPVIYHDFEIAMETVVYIHETTLEQLTKARTTHKDATPAGKSSSSGQTSEVSALAQKGSKLPPSLAPYSDVIPSQARASPDHWLGIPTLQDLLLYLPLSLGLNIEIKYPISPKVEWLGYMTPFSINEYLDAILRVVFMHGGSRKIFFSCFHPDVVAALNVKQARYPVLFLTESGTVTQYRDHRANSLSSAVRFAQEERCEGLVCNSTPFFARLDQQLVGAEEGVHPGESLVKEVHQSGLLLLTWGDYNAKLPHTELQRQWGVDAIIGDNYDDLQALRAEAGIPQASQTIIASRESASAIDDIFVWDEELSAKLPSPSQLVPTSEAENQSSHSGKLEPWMKWSLFASVLAVAATVFARRK